MRHARHQRDKRFYFFLISFLILVGLGLFLWIYESNEIEKNMTEKDFMALQDVPIEVVDTNVFMDEELEKWYLEERQTKGEYVFHKDDATFILISLGEVEEKNTFLLLNGVKVKNGNLLLGYDTIHMDNVGIDFEDSIRSTLIRVNGVYDKIHVIDVQEEEISPAPSSNGTKVD